MQSEFISWRHPTSVGINVEEITGGDDKSGAVRKAMALQVFGENGGDRFREITHASSGAPLLADSAQRISVTHTPRLLAVALLPRTPEADLTDFSIRTAMGIDAEMHDRAQVLNVAPRIMTPGEISLAEEEALQFEKGDAHHQPMQEEPARIRAFILAWTIKEALYKAALQEGMDFKEDLRIERLPEICSFPTVPSPRTGKGYILRAVDPGGGDPGEKKRKERIEMDLFSYESENHIVTLAYSPKCAKFQKK